MRLVIPREVYVKLKRVVDEQFRREWLAQRVYCYFCSSTDIEPHHIARGRKGKSDEACNLMAVCRIHHECCHISEKSVLNWMGTRYPAITLQEQLDTKRRLDPKEWNRERLAELFNGWIPELQTDDRPVFVDGIECLTCGELRKALGPQPPEFDAEWEESGVVDSLYPLIIPKLAELAGYTCERNEDGDWCLFGRKLSEMVDE